MRVFLVFIFFVTILLAQNNESNQTFINKQSITKIKELNKQLSNIEEKLNSNVWYTKYTNHNLYQNFKKQIDQIDKKLKKKHIKKQEIKKLKSQKNIILNKLHLLDEFKNSPFEELLNPKIPKNAPTVKSPFDIISAFTYLKVLKTAKDIYQEKLNNLKSLLELLRKKGEILEQLHQKDLLVALENELDDFQEAYNSSVNTFYLYKKKIKDDKLKITNDIKIQIQRLINIAIMIAVIIIFSIIFKLIVKKTITDNERYYMANKFINFTNLILISFVLLFSFLENVSYLVTVIGFASAGIAIAMKDLFMSLLGWTVIVFGGSIHVGDRIKVTKEGKEFVGDVVDISFLRMTVLEDITYTTLMVNHRAGRMIFIPNNYIFTDVIANYTHEKIKTVWDEIDFIITFDSNHQKAVRIAKEIVKKYSKGYTDISRRQLNQLRNKYSLKNINVEPRVFTFITDYGIKIASWYMTNSYATLTLRSSISASILDAFKEHDDIQLAYPTEVVNIKKDKNIPTIPTGEIPSE